MNTEYTQKAVEDALIGGWREHQKVSVEEDFGVVYIKILDSEDGLCFAHTIHSIVLEPSFWKALGKERGWVSVWKTISKDGFDNDRKNYILEWHSFIDHLDAGGDIESYFENLER